MDDAEFLRYCESMTLTPRCGFVPVTLARLLRLAGEDDLAATWASQPNHIIDHIHNDVNILVKAAYARLGRR